MRHKESINLALQLSSLSHHIMMEEEICYVIFDNILNLHHNLRRILLKEEICSIIFGTITCSDFHH